MIWKIEKVIVFVRVIVFACTRLWTSKCTPCGTLSHRISAHKHIRNSARRPDKCLYWSQAAPGLYTAPCFELSQSDVDLRISGEHIRKPDTGAGALLYILVPNPHQDSTPHHALEKRGNILGINLGLLFTTV